MKNSKNVIDSTLEKQPLIQGTKPRSLRPMRSMVAVRSLKSRTSVVATLAVKPEVAAEKR